jgi:hypothetical protein
MDASGKEEKNTGKVWIDLLFAKLRYEKQRSGEDHIIPLRA